MSAANDILEEKGLHVCVCVNEVPIRDYYTVGEVAQLLHVSREKIRRLERMEDPIPILYLPGKSRGGVVQRDDLHEWIVRNNRIVKADLPVEPLA